MKCLVCQVTWEGGERCPHCGYDLSAADAREPARIQAARRAFQEKTTQHAPETRVRTIDKLRPWLALVLGFAIFVLWVRACASGGFRY